MTATTALTEIRCDGPGGETWGCPHGSVERSTAFTVAEFRETLATQGWDTFRAYDLPVIDRCPNCGNGTA